MELNDFAAHLSVRYRLMVEAQRTNPRTKLYSNARAYLDGLCAGAHALGVGGTPFQVELMANDAFSKMERESGPRPGFEASRNTEQKAWDAAYASWVLQYLKGL